MDTETIDPEFARSLYRHVVHRACMASIEGCVAVVRDLEEGRAPDPDLVDALARLREGLPTLTEWRAKWLPGE